jgi:hypothetical protein
MESCCGKRDRKSLSVTMYIREYERMEARLRSEKGKRLKRRRSAVVEPVFGSLLNYFGMRRSPSKGKDSAHKRMVMAATAYNLKKWLLAKRWPKVVTQVLTLHPESSFFALIRRLTSRAISSQMSCATVTDVLLNGDRVGEKSKSFYYLSTTIRSIRPICAMWLPPGIPILIWDGPSR